MSLTARRLASALLFSIGAIGAVVLVIRMLSKSNAKKYVFKDLAGSRSEHRALQSVIAQVL